MAQKKEISELKAKIETLEKKMKELETSPSFETQRLIAFASAPVLYSYEPTPRKVLGPNDGSYILDPKTGEIVQMDKYGQRLKKAPVPS